MKKNCALEKNKQSMMMDRESLSEWAKDKPLSILQLDPADRAVLRIAGESMARYKYNSDSHLHSCRFVSESDVNEDTWSRND